MARGESQGVGRGHGTRHHRDPLMLDVAYALALYCHERGGRTWEEVLPPAELGVERWPDVFAHTKLFAACGGPRSDAEAFANSLRPDASTILKGLPDPDTLKGARREVQRKWAGKDFASVWREVWAEVVRRTTNDSPPPMADGLTAEATLGPRDGAARRPDSADNRTWTLRLIADRRGQTAFRSALLDHYKMCVVTGCDLEDVLEAAHIKPFAGGGDDELTNGLLLRGDIHTLFDLHLIGVDPDTLQIKWHPRLRKSEQYGPLAARALTKVSPKGNLLPTPNNNRPRPEALLIRWRWFRENGGIA